MHDITGRMVLVTGASSGIGLSLARLFASRGNNLVIVARREDRLLGLKAEIEAEYAVIVKVIVADLGNAQGASNVLAALDGDKVLVDVLVNNAGYSLAGPFHERALPEYIEMMQVGIGSSMALIHALLPNMTQRGYGRVLTIASVAGLMPAVKDHAVYAAAKAFLIRLSLSLDVENRRRNVRFTVVCPGMVRSEFHERSGTQAAMKQLPSWMVMTSDTLASSAYSALAAGQAYRVPGLPNQLAMLLMKWLPMSWVVRLMLLKN